MQEMIKIRESRIALVVKILALGGLTGALSVILFTSSNYYYGYFFGFITIGLTYAVFYTWRHTGIFEVGENILISNKGHGGKAIIKKEMIEDISLKHGKILIELRDNAGTIEFPFGDFTKEEIERLNARLKSI